MEDRIPIPTDNIYKFYALFGLVLFIFGCGSVIYITRSTNELVFQTALEEGAMNQATNAPAVETIKKQVLHKRLEVAVADRKFLSVCVDVISGIGVLLAIFGFQKWHTVVQPIQDEMAKLQLEKLKHEVGQLRHTSPVHEPHAPGHDKQ